MSEANPIVEWRDVQGFPGYQVSNYGEVRSASKPGVHHYPMTLKPEPGDEGHLRVRLFRDKKSHRIYVHRLVLETFVGPCPPHLQVCRHLDNNSQNNFVGNLAWGTQQENMADKKVHGTEQKGERHPSSILKEDQVREIKSLLAQGFGQTEIARRYGVSNYAIHDIATGHPYQLSPCNQQNKRRIRMKRLTPFLCAILGALFGALLVQSPTLQAGDNFSADRVQLNSPASIFRTITPNDSVELTDIPRAVWVGGAGDVVAIGAGDGAKQSGASAANATTLTAYGSLPAYSSGTPGQYVICGDGTHAAEIISGYMATANVITVTTGGGTGGNKTANAHNDQTLIGAYAPFKSASAGGFLPIRPRIILTSGVGTTATNFTGAF